MIKPLLAGFAMMSAMSVNAALIQFEFSGESDEYFGPVTTLTMSFLLDSKAATVTYLTTDSEDNLSRISIAGGVSNFSLNLEGVIAGSPEVQSGMGGQFLLPGESPAIEAWLSFSTQANSIYFNDWRRDAAALTLEDWNNSADPIADFWLNDPTGGGFWLMPVHNQNYHLDKVGGFGYYTITDVTPVPVPATAWLFGSALIGLFGYKRHSTKTS